MPVSVKNTVYLPSIRLAPCQLRLQPSLLDFQDHGDPVLDGWIDGWMAGTLKPSIISYILEAVEGMKSTVLTQLWYVMAWFLLWCVLSQHEYQACCFIQ